MKTNLMSLRSTLNRQRIDNIKVDQKWKEDHQYPMTESQVEKAVTYNYQRGNPYSLDSKVVYAHDLTRMPQIANNATVDPFYRKKMGLEPINPVYN